jgi:predicted acyl esterase
MGGEPVRMVARPAEPPATGGDIPPKFVAPTEANDFVKREVMIPMRDGAHLFTVLVIPKGAHGAPILLTRTPYKATGVDVSNSCPIFQ